MEKELKKAIQEMREDSDLPWYWVSYGEKDYCFAVVSAFPIEDHYAYPNPGSQLYYNENGDLIGENGTRMLIEQEIAHIEEQNGSIICKFIALAHTYLLKE